MNKLVERINNEVWSTLKPSKIHGIGVFAIRDIPEGTILFKGQNELEVYYELSEEEFLQLLEPIRNMILDRTQQEKGKQIKFRHPNCMAKLLSFMNHSTNPNCDGVKALRDINKGEEITETYFPEGDKILNHLILERYLQEGIIKIVGIINA